jgi:hypothetical protein
VGILQTIKKIIFSGDEMDEVKRKQFVQGFQDGYSDPEYPEVGEEWYKIGVQQGKTARNSGMTMGLISQIDRMRSDSRIY